MGQEQQQRDDDDDEDAYDDDTEEQGHGTEEAEDRSEIGQPSSEAAPVVPPPVIPAPVERSHTGVASTGLPVATPARAGSALLVRFLSKEMCWD